MQFTRRCQEVSGTYARWYTYLNDSKRRSRWDKNIDTPRSLNNHFRSRKQERIHGSSRSSADTIGCLHIKQSSFLKNSLYRDSLFFSTTCLASSSNEDISKRLVSSRWRTSPFSLEREIFKMIEFDLRDPDQASPSGQPGWIVGAQSKRAINDV